MRVGAQSERLVLNSWPHIHSRCGAERGEEVDVCGGVHNYLWGTELINENAGEKLEALYH